MAEVLLLLRPTRSWNCALFCRPLSLEASRGRKTVSMGWNSREAQGVEGTQVTTTGSRAWELGRGL